MEQQLVGLLGRGRAIVARDRDFETGRDDAALDDLKTAEHVVRHRHGVGAFAFGDRQRDGGSALKVAVVELGHRPGAMIRLGCADDDIGDVLDVDRAAVAGGQQQQADVGNAL